MNLCTICHKPVSPDDRAATSKVQHIECALSGGLARIAASSAQDKRAEERKQAGELAMARLVAAKHERERIARWMRAKAENMPGWEAQSLLRGFATAIEDEAHLKEEP